MGVKFTKATIDGTIICDPRGGWIANMGLQDNPLTENWTELRIGAFVSTTSVAADNGAHVSEAIASVGPYDYFMFGIKDDDETKLFKVADTQFWGAAGVAGVATTLVNPSGFYTNTVGGAQFLSTFYASDGVTVNSDDTGTGASGEEAFNLPSVTEAQAATLYAKLWGLQFIRANPGAATQTVQIYKWGTNSLFTDTSISNLRTQLNAFAANRWGTGPTITANAGGVAFTAPDSWYIRWPFINSRLRIHSAMFVVVAP